jgi:hypothetical protein
MKDRRNEPGPWYVIVNGKLASRTFASYWQAVDYVHTLSGHSLPLIITITNQL